MGVLALLVAGAPAFLDWSFRNREIARVAVPESTLVVVLKKDFKEFVFYEVWEHGQRISDRRYVVDRVPGNERAMRMTRRERGIRITWGDWEYPYVHLDPSRQAVISDSSGGGYPLAP